MGKQVKITKDNLELFKFYSEQRDSQLKQLMEINGKATFTVTATLATLFLGAFSLKDSENNFLNNLEPIYSILAAVLIIVGIIALFLASYFYSTSYSKNIQHLENLLYNLSIEDGEEIEHPSQGNIFKINPSENGNKGVFLGLMAILLGTLIIIVGNVKSSDTPKPKESMVVLADHVLLQHQKDTIEKISTIKIFNLSDELVIELDTPENNEEKIDLSNLPSGEYKVQISTDKGHTYDHIIFTK